MANVPSVAGGAVEQLTVEHDATPNPRGDHHRHEVLAAHGSTDPTLGQRKSLRIEIAIDRQLRNRLQAVAQRVITPHRNVEGRHGGAVWSDRTSRTDADHDGTSLMVPDSSSKL